MNMMSPGKATGCGLDSALPIIAGKWKPTIIWTLHVQPLRFGQLRRQVKGISEKVLVEQLRELECDGIVERREFDETVLRVEYSLTPSGAKLNAAVHALAEWGTGHKAAMPGAAPGLS
jgi:DNA-binding HxlR family transcriptional regulator